MYTKKKSTIIQIINHQSKIKNKHTMKTNIKIYELISTLRLEYEFYILEKNSPFGVPIWSPPVNNMIFMCAQRSHWCWFIYKHIRN